MTAIAQWGWFSEYCRVLRGVSDNLNKCNGHKNVLNCCCWTMLFIESLKINNIMSREHTEVQQKMIFWPHKISVSLEGKKYLCFSEKGIEKSPASKRPLILSRCAKSITDGLYRVKRPRKKIHFLGRNLLSNKSKVFHIFVTKTFFCLYFFVIIF